MNKQISFLEAKNLVLNSIGTPKSVEDELIIVDTATVEQPYAWIFVYTNKLWLATRDPKYAIAGNAPIFVNKVTGQLQAIGTAYAIDTQISMYEEEHKIWQLRLDKDESLDNEKMLLLKNTLKFNYEALQALRKDTNTYLAQGSNTRLKALQAELFELGIRSELDIQEIYR